MEKYAVIHFYVDRENFENQFGNLCVAESFESYTKIFNTFARAVGYVEEMMCWYLDKIGGDTENNDVLILCVVEIGDLFSFERVKWFNSDDYYYVGNQRKNEG